MKKDFNSMLEDVLEKKDFSNEIKNLLLSMFYKIEERYDDYKKVKVTVNDKEEFISTILEIIKNHCEKIENKDELLILEEILKKENKIFLKENDSKIIMAINEILKTGYIIDACEVLKNFTGWSWNPDVESNEYNLTYQTIRILLGNKFIQNVKKIESIEERFVKFYGDLIGKLIYTKFVDISLNLIFRKKKIEYEKELAVMFLKCFKILVERVTEKKDITRLIYELRYYESINKSNFTEIEDLLIEKAVKNKVLNSECENLEINFIFKETIIELEDVGGKNASNISRSNKNSNRIKFFN